MLRNRRYRRVRRCCAAGAEDSRLRMPLHSRLGEQAGHVVLTVCSARNSSSPIWGFVRPSVIRSKEAALLIGERGECADRHVLLAAEQFRDDTTDDLVVVELEQSEERHAASPNTTANVLPAPTAVSTVIRASSSSARRLQMCSPNPVPSR